MDKPRQLLFADPFVCPYRKHKFAIGPFDAPNIAIQVRVLALRRDGDRKSSYKSLGRCHFLNELAMHPTVKPVALVADILKDASRRSDLVLDPFAGSGTTIIAAEKTGRQACALEIDQNYVDVIIQRWQLYTGKVALFGATGATFEELSEQRQSETPASAAAPVNRGVQS